MTHSAQESSAASVKRDIGFAASVLGFGLVAIIALVYFTRSPPGQDPTLDGTEQFAEEIGHGFVGLLLVLAGMSTSLVFGGLGAILGSKAGKTLLTIGCMFVILSAATFVVDYYSSTDGLPHDGRETFGNSIGSR